MSTIIRIVRLALLLSLCFFIFACSATKVKQRVLMPAHSSGMKNVTKLAVIGFSGDRENTFNNKIESYLSGIRVKNEPYFKIIDKTTMNSLYQKQVSEEEKKAMQVRANQAPKGSEIVLLDTSTTDSPGVQISIDPMAVLSALLSKPEKIIANAISRIERRKSQLQIVNQQLR